MSTSASSTTNRDDATQRGMIDFSELEIEAVFEIGAL